MAALNLLFKDQIEITDSIHVMIPTIREIMDSGQEDYYQLVGILVSTPFDQMVTLDDAGIDFTAIDDYEMFILFFPLLAKMKTDLVFGDLDLTKFSLGVDKETEDPVLIDAEQDIVIDRTIHRKICYALRTIHHMERNRKKAGNDEAKEYLLERARLKAKRKKTKENSELERTIIALVNCVEFKYNFETVKDLTIYQFNESVRQILRKIRFDNLMNGIYSGCVDTKSIPKEDMDWIS